MNTKLLLLFLFFLSLFPLSVFPQGFLTPPAAPTPTMKTLDQVEPRIPIDTTHTSGNGSYDYIISQPGSYYFTGNIDVIKGNGIQITAADVTLDLNGFELSRSLAGGTDAIDISASAQGVTIRNGSIKGFSNAITATGSHVICEQLLLTASGSRTLSLGADAVVKDCKIDGGGIFAGVRSAVRETVVNSTANVNIDLNDDAQVVGLTFNTGRGELLVGNRSLIADCQINAVGPPTLLINGTVVSTADGVVVRNCSISAGNVAGGAMQVGSGSLVTGCRILQAFRDGITSANANVTVESCSVQGIGRYGITLGAQARVRDCIVQGSGSDGIAVGDSSIVSDSTVAGGQAIGILASNGCNIRHCTVQGNAGDGIQAVDRCQIIDCNSNGNGNGTTGSGITGGLRTTVKNCTAAENQKSGIVVLGASVVLENNAAHNGQGGAAAGIDSSGGSGSRIEANMVRNNNGTGILGASNDVIIRNYSFSNSTNYNPTSGNNFGPIELPSTATHPTANF